MDLAARGQRFLDSMVPRSMTGNVVISIARLEHLPAGEQSEELHFPKASFPFRAIWRLLRYRIENELVVNLKSILTTGGEKTPQAFQHYTSST